MDELLKALARWMADQQLDAGDPRIVLAAEVAALSCVLIRSDAVVLQVERSALEKALSTYFELDAATGASLARFMLEHATHKKLPQDALLTHVARRSNEEKLVVVDALLQIGAADGALQRQEALFIDSIALRLGVSSDSYRNLLRKWDPQASPGTRRTKLGDSPLTIGSAPDNAIQLDGLSVSRHHAVLQPTPNGWIIEDLGSKNGTWVSGRRIRRTRLEAVDQVRIEHHSLRIDPRRNLLWIWDTSDFLTVSTEAISVDVPDRDRRGETKRILDAVSLSVHSGEVLALMGPSGSGKTTLVNAMLGTVPLSGGVVHLNGEACNLLSEHASEVGVVPQDDIVYGQLSVEESLRFSAQLRSVPGTPSESIDAAVEGVLEQLGLVRIRHSRIGSPDRRGVSGGERKRVNIGQELLNPGTRFLVLDEPTTGLDPHTSMEIMRILRGLADQGRAVIAVTHQVDEQLLSLVDKVLLLGTGGQLAYFGPADRMLPSFGVSDVPALFAELGHPKRARELSNWFRSSGAYQRHVVLPRLLRRSGPEGSDAFTDEADLKGQLPVSFDGESDTAEGFPNVNPGFLETATSGIPSFSTLVAEQEARATSTLSDRQADLALPPQVESGPDSSRLGDRLRGWVGQLVVLVRRYARVKWRDRTALLVALGQVPLIVIGCWLVLIHTVAYQDARLGETFHTIPGSLPFVLVVSAFWLGSVNAVREVVADQTVFRRERHAGVRVSSYLLSKAIVLFSLTAVQCLMLAGAAHMLFGFGARHVSGISVGCVLVLVGLFGASLGLVVSASFRTPEAAVSVLPAMVIPQLLFGGLLVPLHKMPIVLRYVSFLAASRWGMDGFLQSGEPAVTPGGVAMVSECTQYSPPSGESGMCVQSFLVELGFAREQAVEGSLLATRIVVDSTYGQCCMALVALSSVAIALAGIRLWRKR